MYDNFIALNTKLSYSPIHTLIVVSYSVATAALWQTDRRHIVNQHHQAL